MAFVRSAADCMTLRIKSRRCSLSFSRFSSISFSCWELFSLHTVNQNQKHEHAPVGAHTHSATITLLSINIAFHSFSFPKPSQACNGKRNPHNSSHSLQRLVKSINIPFAFTTGPAALPLYLRKRNMR